MRLKKVLLISITMIFSFVLISCSKKYSINISGSTTVLPVVSKAAEKYKLQHSGLQIVVNAGGSGVGMNQFGLGNIQIGMASREIDAEEIAQYPKVNFIKTVIGRDAVVPVVSSEIYDAGVTQLSLTQIGKIYKGQVKNWKEFGGPDREILCIDKEKSRGTRHVFMTILFGNKLADAPGADLVLGSNNEEQTAISQSNAAIGMLSNAWMNDDVKGLSIVLQDGKVIPPTLVNIKNGSFPITRNLNLYTNGKSSGSIKSFVDFILSNEGQKIVEESGYIGVIK